MQLIDIRDATKSQREENAAAIRDLADQVERGDITECSIVANDIANNVYTCHLQFEDRWRLLAALEYARSKVHEG
jgi:hypothetical protein